MVIVDNETRWNSTFLSLKRGIQLYNKIQVFLINHRDELGEFFTSRRLGTPPRYYNYLEPFKRIIKHLEGYAANRHHGAI